MIKTEFHMHVGVHISVGTNGEIHSDLLLDKRSIVRAVSVMLFDHVRNAWENSLFHHTELVAKLISIIELSLVRASNRVHSTRYEISKRNTGPTWKTCVVYLGVSIFVGTFVNYLALDYVNKIC